MTTKDMYIRLDGLKIFAHHGVLPQERVVGAEFIIDIALKTDFSKATETDDLSYTLNYAEIFSAIKQEMAVPSKLLEHVSRRIAERLFHEFGNLSEIQIKLYKQNPPMGADADRIGVEAVYQR